MSYLLTGSQDGYIRCYDFWASANGKSLMTAQARGVANLGDGVTKGGVARGYWKNEVDVEEPEEVDKPKNKPAVAAPSWLQVDETNREPSPPPKMTVRRKLEPVYSLAIQGDGLWALSGSKVSGAAGACGADTGIHSLTTLARPSTTSREPSTWRRCGMLQAGSYTP
jgi:transcriptional activator SPT8